VPIDPREWLQNSAPLPSDRVEEESTRSEDEADAEVAPSHCANWRRVHVPDMSLTRHFRPRTCRRA
jgi:hypothetical protein